MKYNLKKFSNKKIRILLDGIFQNIDIRYFCDERFNLKQMKLIKKDLLKGKDVSKYANPKYSLKKMKAIKKIIEENANQNKINNIYMFKDKNNEYLKPIKDYRKQKEELIISYINVLNEQDNNNKIIKKVF